MTPSPELDPRAGREDRPDARGGHGGHGWMMIVCCIPMLVIALALLTAGVVGVGFLLVAVACTAMMALMMRGMSSGDGHRH